MVEDGGWGEGGGRWLKCGRPHKFFVFNKEKYSFVLCERRICLLTTLDDHISMIYTLYFFLQDQWSSIGG